jgi:hypothetical protein
MGAHSSRQQWSVACPNCRALKKARDCWTTILIRNGIAFVHFYKAAQHSSALCEGKYRAFMGSRGPYLTAQMPPMADWHKVCKTLFRPTVNAVEWAAPSVNDDRLAEQVAGNIGGSGIDA